MDSWFLQYDNAPPHRAKSYTHYLTFTRPKLLDFPYSLDLCDIALLKDDKELVF